MRTSDYDYELPRELIAMHPADRRDGSRLMVLAGDGEPIHREFGDLAEYFREGDLLIMNDSRVMKARLRGVRRETGAGVEALLLGPGRGNEPADGTSRWVAMCRPARKFRVGEMIDFGGGILAARVVAEGNDGERVLEFAQGDILPLLDKHGEIPLPPYIVQRRRETGEGDHDADTDDLERYQTVYARQPGSVAAPTAGLHFTPGLLEAIRGRGVEAAWVTLHVGAGTFKPVEVDDPAAHPIHSEYCEVPQETADLIAATKARGGRVFAVGTTTVRTLESAWRASEGRVVGGGMWTNLLILPGYEFKVVDGLVTNFHLPRSSLLMMVSALAGHGRIMTAYDSAIRAGYRFYSYGDAMLILPGGA